MRRKQMVSMLVLAMVWLMCSGFTDLGEGATAGIGSVVEPMDNKSFETLQAMVEWNGRCMPDVEEYVTIRREASADAEAVGRLYKGDAADILGGEGEWTYISSGDCEGYVADQYLAFEADAKEIAERDCDFVATVTAETLKVRAEASEEAKTLDLIGEGTKLNVSREEDGWLVVDYSDGEEGYINADYATVEFEIGQAQTMEQIEAAEAAIRAAEEKAALQKNYNAVSASTDDVTLLAALIQVEAGNESYDGQVAVGAVVMNRVRSGSYPGSISGVVFQGGQFPPAASGRVNSIAAGGPKASCMQAAQEAIGGVSNVGAFTHFKSARSSVNGASITIGNHVFY